MIDDSELLRDYARSRSEDAFSTLVHRHLGLVYSVALRSVHGDAHLAEDVTQQVFVRLAHHAGRLEHHPALGGWLYRTTHNLAVDLMRQMHRRRIREQEAVLMNSTEAHPRPDPENEPRRPILDEAIAGLGERDRAALLLHFFENRTYGEIGRRLQLSEGAVRMRVNRALEKLQSHLARRGVTSTAAPLGTALAGQAATSVPAGLATSVLSGALAGASSSSAASLLTLITMSNVKTGLILAIAAVGAGLILHQSRLNNSLAQSLEQSAVDPAALVALEQENRQLAAVVAELDSYRGDDALLAQLQQEIAVRQEALVPESRTDLGPIYQLAELDRPPQPTRQTMPDSSITQELRRAGISGEATVTFLVDAKGQVSGAAVKEANHPAIGALARETVQDWEFSPALKDGNPVSTQMAVPIILTLIRSRSEAAPEQPAGWVPLP